MISYSELVSSLSQHMVSNFKLRLAADSAEVQSVSLLEKFSNVSNLPAVVKEMLATPKAEPVYEVTPFREEAPKSVEPVLKKKKKAAAPTAAERAEEVNRLALEMLAKQKAAKEKKTRITKAVPTSKGDYLNWMGTSANKDYTPVKISSRGAARATPSASPLKSGRKVVAKKKSKKDPALAAPQPGEALNLRIGNGDTLTGSREPIQKGAGAPGAGLSAAGPIDLK